jgi:hypothetical protein
VIKVSLPPGIYQDPATTTMEGIYLFNLHLLFVIIGIVLLVDGLFMLY